jgi:hypothetical protein
MLHCTRSLVDERSCGYVVRRSNVALAALSAFLDVSSLNLAVLQGTAIFLREAPDRMGWVTYRAAYASVTMRPAWPRPCPSAPCRAPVAAARTARSSRSASAAATPCRAARPAKRAARERSSRQRERRWKVWPAVTVTRIGNAKHPSPACSPDRPSGRTRCRGDARGNPIPSVHLIAAFLTKAW